jgi:hypothetical protein
MNKSEFKKHISTIHDCTQLEADKVIDMSLFRKAGDRDICG